MMSSRTLTEIRKELSEREAVKKSALESIKEELKAKGIHSKIAGSHLWFKTPDNRNGSVSVWLYKESLRYNAKGYSWMEATREETVQYVIETATGQPNEAERKADKIREECVRIADMLEGRATIEDIFKHRGSVLIDNMLFIVDYERGKLQYEIARMHQEGPYITDDNELTEEQLHSKIKQALNKTPIII